MNYEKIIYSERSWEMEHFLFLQHALNHCRDNCVWSWRFLKSVYYSENMNAMKIHPWINQSCVLTRKILKIDWREHFFKNFVFYRLTTTAKKYWILASIHNYWFRDEFSLRLCFRCNTQISKIPNFKRNYPGNNNDSEVTVKTKNAPFLMNFPNTSFFHSVFSEWIDPLKIFSSTTFHCKGLTCLKP